MFHRGDAQRARPRDAWVCGVAQQGPGAPAKQAARPGARRRDAMDVECFGQNELDPTISSTFHCEKAGKNTATAKYPG